MSREVSSTTTYNAQAMTQISAALPHWYRQNASVTAGMTSNSLQELTQDPNPLQPETAPIWVQQLTDDVQKELFNPDLRLGVINRLREPLVLAETTVTTGAVTQSLAAEGFMTRVVTDGDLGFVEARRGHETILVEVEGTRIHRDRAGLDDESCANSDTAFEAQMASRGFRLVTEQLSEHRSVPGGELIRSAASRNRRNLAEGALRARRSVNPGAVATGRVLA